MKIAVLPVVLIALSLVSCNNVVIHDEVEAIKVTNQFLKSDLAGRHKDAYGFFDDAFKHKVSFDNYVKRGINNNPNLGKLRKAEFKYFMLVGTQAYLELIYDCNFEKVQNVPLHIILSGSKSKGYKITVLDIGYNYKSFGEDENKRPKIKVNGTYIVRPQ